MIRHPPHLLLALFAALQNLPVDADKLFLYEKFSPYGAILSVKVLNDPQSGQCRGVGFVVSVLRVSGLHARHVLMAGRKGAAAMRMALLAKSCALLPGPGVTRIALLFPCS